MVLSDGQTIRDVSWEDVYQEMNLNINDIFTLIVIIFAITVVVLGIATYIHQHAFASPFLDGTNATDVNWGLEFKDDNLEEEEEIEDEKEHERESRN